MKVPVREYYGKNGEFDRGDVEVSSELDNQSQQIINLGLQFTIEYIDVLDKASICLEDYDRGDYKIEFVAMEKQVLEKTIEGIVAEFSVEDYQQWCNEIDNYEYQLED